jgi:hypothetical protein
VCVNQHPDRDKVMDAMHGTEGVNSQEVRVKPAKNFWRHAEKRQQTNDISVDHV